MSDYGLNRFLKTATSAFVDDFSAVIRTTTAPMRIAGNHIYAVVMDLEVSSQRHLQSSLDRARIYNQFVGFKNHFATAPDSNGKYVYHFLCSVEALQSGEGEQLIYAITAYIHADPESAILKIGQAMRKLCETSMTRLEDRQMLALGR